MKLSELIAAVGDDNITFQTLATDTKSANIFKSEGQVTFCTAPKMVRDMLKTAPEFIGLVVWIPKEHMPEMAVSQEEDDEN